MPYIKDTFSILAECAAIDLPNTERVVRESQIISDYESIEEAETDYVVVAEMVPVVQIGEEYFTEAQFLAPFMRDAGIKSMTEALDAVAESNNLPEKSVGLLIESSKDVNKFISKAAGKSKDVINKTTDKVKEVIKDDERRDKINKAADKTKDVINTAADKGKDIVNKNADRIDKAIKTGKDLADKAADKVSKATDLAKDLKAKGYPVKRKKDK